MNRGYGVDVDDVSVLAWKSPGLGRNLTFCALQAVLYLSLVLLLESAAVRRCLQAAVSRAMSQQVQRPQPNTQVRTCKHDIVCTNL